MSNICFNWQWKHDWSVSLVGPPTPKSRASWLLAWKNLCCHNSWRTCYSCTLCPSSSPFKTLDKFIVVTESESIYRWQNIPSFLCLLSIISSKPLVLIRIMCDCHLYSIIKSWDRWVWPDILNILKKEQIYFYFEIVQNISWFNKVIQMTLTIVRMYFVFVRS